MLRVRASSFADHYSQARQFYINQKPVEQTHIGDALTFELSKVATPAIRARVVAHLRNIDEDLAETVAQGLRLGQLPPAADAAQPTRTAPAASPALSILRNGPDRFAGRKVGVLVTDGATARDFVTDAFAHAKFIGHVDAAMPMLDEAGIAADLDEGCIAFNGAASPAAFVEQCRQLRHWPREQTVDQT